MNGIVGKIGLLVVLLSSAGCVISTAEHKKLSLLQPGVPRQTIVSEFGEPLLTLFADGLATDVYGFYQGFTGASRYLASGMPDVELNLMHEPDIKVKPREFRESEPEDETQRAAWAERKRQYEWDEFVRCSEINSYNAEAIAAQEARRAEDRRNAEKERLQQIQMLALDHVPGFPGLALSNPDDRPGSAGIVVFAVTYDKQSEAKLFDIAHGEKLVDQARKKSGGWFAKKPAALPKSGFFKIALEHPRASIRSTVISKISVDE